MSNHDNLTRTDSLPGGMMSVLQQKVHFFQTKKTSL